MSSRWDIDSVLAEPLAPARGAGVVTGYVGLDIPEDVLAASGPFAIHLPWDRQLATPFADEWLEDSFPGWARCALEGWEQGQFDFLEHVVFSRGDDVSQRLYYYVCELQRQGKLGGPRPVVFDVARIPRESGVAWTTLAVERLASDLGIDDDQLEAGIRTANERRARLQAIASENLQDGAVLERLARAGLFAPVESLAWQSTDAAADRRRLLLAGSPPPDDGLHEVVARAGWNVAGEVHTRNLSRLGPLIAESGPEPAKRIAVQVLANAVGPRAFTDMAARVLKTAEACAAEAVILWLYEEDEAFAWDVVGAERALADAGIPVMVMARRRWDLSDDPVADIDSFLGGLSP